MLNKNIPIEKLRDLKMLVLDSDGVTIPRGTKINQTCESDFFDVHFQTKIITDELAEMINQLQKKIKICISSGRSLIYLQTMYSKIIGEGAILQAENGNLTLIETGIFQLYTNFPIHFKKLTAIREDIKKLPISGFEPKQFILTVHASEEIKEIYDIVKKHDPEEELKVMWNGEAFDIQSKEMSKGLGLKGLLEYLNIKPKHTIAIGDRINDKELLEVAGIGVSADPEALRAEYWTTGQELPGQQLVEYLLKNLP